MARIGYAEDHAAARPSRSRLPVSSLDEMTAGADTLRERHRTAELLASACLATDLGMGFPFEHGLHATLIAMRLSDELGVDPDAASQAHYSCLLMYSGCTADADIATRIFAGDLGDKVAPVQFGRPADVLRAVISSLPPPESAGFGRALEVMGRLPRALRARKRSN